MSNYTDTNNTDNNTVCGISASYEMAGKLLDSILRFFYGEFQWITRRVIYWLHNSVLVHLPFICVTCREQRRAGDAAILWNLIRLNVVLYHTRNQWLDILLNWIGVFNLFLYLNIFKQTKRHIFHKNQVCLSSIFLPSWLLFWLAIAVCASKWN